MRTYTTRPAGASRVRYLRCNACGYLGKQVVELDTDGQPKVIPDFVLQRGTEFVDRT